MNIKTVYEDDFIVAFSKPAGVLSANLKGRNEKSIESEFSLFPIHRLDRDTSGINLFAKNKDVQNRFQNEFKERNVQKFYKCLVIGNTPEKGRINSPLIRRENLRTKFRVSGKKNSRNAITEFKKEESIKTNISVFSLINVQIFTGRTHQIRVHLSSINFPVAGDNDYGKKEINLLLKDKLNLKRQFLHAERIILNHPLLDEKLDLHCPIPDDLSNSIANLRNLN